MLGGKPEAILGSSLLFLLSSSPSASRSALLQCPTTSHHPYTAGILAGALSAHLLCGNHLPTDLLLASSVGFPLSSQKEPLKLGRAHHTSAQSPLPAFYLTRKAKILTRALRPTQSTDITPPSVQLLRHTRHLLPQCLCTCSSHTAMMVFHFLMPPFLANWKFNISAWAVSIPLPGFIFPLVLRYTSTHVIYF